MKVRNIKKKLYARIWKQYKLNDKLAKQIINSFKQGLLKTTTTDSIDNSF